MRAVLFCLQAILHAAYLRQALQSPLPSASGSSGGAAGSSGGGPRGSAEEDCCVSCRSADRRAALKDSQRCAVLSRLSGSSGRIGWRLLQLAVAVQCLTQAGNAQPCPLFPAVLAPADVRRRASSPFCASWRRVAGRWRPSC